MSTTTPTTTAAGGETSTSSPSPHTNTDTTTLYLFTFLATILILVLLSASLVLRSYILRRRYRQRLQHALADGFFPGLDNGTGQFDTFFRRSARQIGPKPVVFDNWIHPADKVETWSSVTPVAVRCSPALPPPSPSISSPQPSAVRLGPSSSPQAQSRSSFFPHLRVPSPFTFSPRSSPPPRQGSSPIRSPTLTSTSPPAVPTSPDPSIRTGKDAAALVVCVLVAMPDASASVHRDRPSSDAKGKRIDPLKSQVRQQSGDKNPLLPSSARRSGARIPDDDERLPVLEFGVVEASTGEWIWTN